MSMMDLRSLEYPAILFGDQTLFCITSKYLSHTHIFLHKTGKQTKCVHLNITECENVNIHT